MTAFTGFFLAAAVLILIVLGLLLPPLWRAPKLSGTADQRAATLDIFRDQLGELERDRDEGSLAESDFNQAKNELQRRLLDEVQPEGTIVSTAGGRKTALFLILAIPLVALAGYMLLGKPQALDPANTKPRVSPQQIDDMLGKLVERLKANPDDSKGWVMLARSYKVLGRFADAAEAYSHGAALVDADPVLLADYAETLVQAGGGKFDGKPDQLIARALQIDPNEPQALFLAGASATERKDFPAVIDYWSRLLQQLEPGSEEAQSLAAAVNKTRELVGQGTPADAAATPTAVRKEAISGEVMLSGTLAAQAGPDDLLFIFARANEGSRMPLAVVRARVSDLPLTYRFDDSMALPGGRKISDLPSLSIEARVAKSGQAQSSSGDLFGSIRDIKPGSTDVRLLIDQIQP